MNQEERMRIWLNYIVDNFPGGVGIAGSGGGFLFRCDLLMSQKYYQKHPEQCWLFQIGGLTYQDVFPAKLVERIEFGSSITIYLKTGNK